MRFSKLTFTLFILLINYAYGQTPFTTLVKEPRFLETKNNISGKPRYVPLSDTADIKAYINGNKTLAGRTITETQQNDFDFFKNNGLTLNLIQKGENRVSVNSQVLYYKLFLANPNENNKYRKNRFNIPLMLITKLSSNYDSINASSALDVLDYEAAPISLRIMPSWRKAFKNYSDQIYYGFYADVRGINYHNTVANNYDIDFIGSGGLGFTYQGDGQAGSYNTNGEYAEGKYSISVMYQAAVGKNVLQKLFATNKDYVSSLQGYFVFKVSESNPANLKLGYQYFFDKTLAGSRSNFSLSLGI